MPQQLRAALLHPFALIALGALWAGAAFLLPKGVAYGPAIVALGGLFGGLYVWSLLMRLRAILGDSASLGQTLRAVGFDFALLVLAFACVYSALGVQDSSGPQPQVTHHFPTALYFSVVTFTTLGYGDIAPLQVGRIIAAFQSLIGYFVLAAGASVTASIISPHQAPNRDPRAAEE